MLCLFRSRISDAGRLSSNVFRAHTRPSINSNITSPRGYATSKLPSASKIPPRPPRPSAAQPPRIPIKNLDVNTNWKRTQLAENLFKQGDRILYQSVRRTTFFRVNSWLLGAGAALGIATIWANGFLDPKTFQKTGNRFAKYLPIAYTIVGVFLGSLLGIAWTRTRFHVHSIALVQHSAKVLLQIHYRSAFPFVKRSFVVEPYNLSTSAGFPNATKIPQRLLPRAPSESSPSEFTAGVIRETFKTISRSFFHLTDAFAAYFLRRGMYDIEIEQEVKGVNKTEKYIMDATGMYLMERDVPVLWDIVVVNDPNGRY